MKCEKCGTEHSAKFCPECGAPATAQTPMYQSAPPATKKKGGCLKVGLIIFGVFVVLGALGSVLGGENTAAPAPSVPVSVAASTPATSDAEKIAKNLGISVELASDLQDKYAQIGIDDIEKIEKIDNWESGMRFNATYEDYILTAYELDGKVQSIRSGDVYFYDNGSVAFTVQEKLLTVSQELHLMSYAETAVENSLKSPKSADFPGHVMDKGEWTVRRADDGTYFVKSYVDAENSFGASLRSDFIVTFAWDGKLESVPTATDVQLQAR